MKETIIGLICAAFGAIIGYFFAMRTTTRTEAIRVFGQIKTILINQKVIIQSHTNCPLEDVEKIIPECSALLLTLTPLLSDRNKYKVNRAWRTFCFGENPKHHDERDITHEYLSATDTVKETRDKALNRIHNILNIKI